MRILRIWSYTFIAATLLAGVVACGQTAATPTAVPTAIPSPTATIAAATLQPADSERTLTVNGVERTYLLHLPPGLAADQPVPLVFVFHGVNENGAFISQTSGFNEIADANGFIVVYPNGSGPSSALSWNAGGCCGYASQNKIDETALVHQVISDVETLVKIDPKRVYAAGFCNGALLSYYLACEMSDTFAAIAPVAGVLLFSPCQPQQSVSVIHFHGLSDTTVPYAGGVVGGEGMIPGTNQAFPPVEQSIATWVRLDACTESPQVEQSGILTHTSYASCQNGTAVELYTVNGIEHSWPSQYVVPVSEIIWDFFEAHPKP